MSLPRGLEKTRLNELRRAVWENDIALVKQSLLTGTDVNGVVDGSGTTALHCAASGGVVNECVKELLEANADVNKATRGDLFTPLHVSAKDGRVEFVKVWRCALFSLCG